MQTVLLGLLSVSRRLVPSTGARLSWGIFASAPAIVILLSMAFGPNHDIAWILMSSELMLDGGEFGDDVVDVNPPLIWWISLPVNYFSQLSSIPVYVVWQFSVLALIFVVVATCARARELTLRQAAVLAFILSVLPGYHFGQRDHLVAVCLVPYVLGIGCGRGGRGLGAALLAAIGIALKPHYVTILILIEGYIAFRSKRYRMSMIRLSGVVLVGLLYLLIVKLSAPSYLSEVLPAARASYEAYNLPLRGLLFYGLAVIALATIMVLVTGRRGWPTGILLAVLGALIAGILQGKGFNYHFLPALLFASVGVLLRWESIEGASLRERSLKKAAAVVAVVSVLFSIGNGLEAGMRKVKYVDPLVTVINLNAEPGDGVVVLATSPSVVQSAILMSESRGVGSACCLFTLPQYLTDKSDRHFLQWQLETLSEDIRIYEPRLLILDHREPQLALHGRFDYRTLFRSKELAPVLNGYREILSGPDYVVLRLVN